MGGGAEGCNTALAEIHVNRIVEDGGGGVADDGGEEDEGYDCVAEVVVCFELEARLLILVISSRKTNGDLHMGSMPI